MPRFNGAISTPLCTRDHMPCSVVKDVAKVIASSFQFLCYSVTKCKTANASVLRG